MIDVVAVITCLILAGLAVFQFALILGAPIGRYAWGGKHTVLPTNLRIGSIISILLYGVFATIILSEVNIVPLFANSPSIDVLVWVLAIYFWVGVFMNGISRSKPERNLMTPLALVLAIAVTYIALS